jgi:hypothetical protein
MNRRITHEEHRSVSEWTQPCGCEVTVISLTKVDTTRTITVRCKDHQHLPVRYESNLTRAVKKDLDDQKMI